MYWNVYPMGGGPGRSLFPCSPQGNGRSARPGPSYLEMPQKAQMFSVRLPSLSTKHEEPLGPRGHFSHAAGTMETTQGSEGVRLSHPPSPAQPTPPHPTPKGPMTLHLSPHQACPSPPTGTHPALRRTHPHEHPRLTATGRLKCIQGYTITYASPRHADLDAHSVM